VARPRPEPEIEAARPESRAAPRARPSRVARAQRANPSFDCGSASTSVERAICADPRLADKDRRMALLYEAAGGSRHGPVDPSQWRWLAARNACAGASGGALRACIGRAYDARIADLSGAR